MKKLKQLIRRENTLSRLKIQLKSGVKNTWGRRDESKQVEPLTEWDKKRIKKEIAILEKRVKI